MSYEVRLADEVTSFLKDLDLSLALRVIERLQELGEDPRRFQYQPSVLEGMIWTFVVEHEGARWTFWAHYKFGGDEKAVEVNAVVGYRGTPL